MSETIWRDNGDDIWWSWRIYRCRSGNLGVETRPLWHVSPRIRGVIIQIANSWQSGWGSGVTSWWCTTCFINSEVLGYLGHQSILNLTLQWLDINVTLITIPQGVTSTDSDCTLWAIRIWSSRRSQLKIQRQRRRRRHRSLMGLNPSLSVAREYNGRNPQLRIKWGKG